ncbi:excinuclease ABC subunit UvrA [Nocardioides alkalitolerans]|uniref:excinuclease ABC subunit UvrA n=1 Tax=Nocardioides alkalitolerans TaxID=281714 RepID=UPI001B7F81DC|nr:excinuclease ABC subunit UvrA [Nocardioides alkalitolerans]
MRGASEHNLRDVDVDLPRNALVVFTGVSGSGKSSLAFGTIYAEAQRRYFESVAPYARRLLQQVGAPHVEEISGLPPAVALQQRRGSASSRSTVGTMTTLSNLLRVLYSRAGDYPAGSDRLAAEAFSPNTTAGACSECQGLGVTHDVTEELLVPDPSLSIREGAIAAWPGAWQGHNLRRIVTNLGIDVDRPWRELAPEDRSWLLFTDERPSVLIRPQDKDGGGGRDYHGTFRSARSHVRNVLATSSSESARAKMAPYVASAICRACHGSGLRPEALAVTFAGVSIAAMNALPLADVAEKLRPGAGGDPDDPAARISADLVARIEVLLDLGLGYLTLARTSTTLSPGEAQRLRIATQLRAGLFGVVYVLDEPSAGLHPADAEPLLAVLDQLKAAGNSLFVVEHDLDVVRRADWIVDIGPGAGAGGGSVLYSGPVPGLEAVHDSPTSDYLFGRSVRQVHAPRTLTDRIRMSGVTRHNLRDVSLDLPLGAMTAVTGVSGSGKSTLVVRVLADAVRHHLGTTAPETDDEDDRPSPVDVTHPRISGVDALDRLVVVDQRPIGRTPRSTLATYTGLFDVVRRVFAATPSAKERGYGVGRFSFNVAEGRCETCQGEGFVSVELVFLPGTHAPCPTCGGARYNAETLEVTYRDRNVADVLTMSVDAAAEFLADVPAAARSLGTLQEVGLGYLSLGQPATELSGGEAQRIKLATELQRVSRGHTLYLLDEPTAGLHPADADLLLTQLHRLVDAGNTVVLVEHDLPTIAGADWVVDLGPGGGDAGGRVVAEGTPTEIAAGTGATGRYLAAHLARRTGA